MSAERLKLDWYTTRLDQNKRIKSFLIDEIKKSGVDLGIDYNDLVNLNYEDLFELAIACVNKSITITLGASKDYNDNSDAKFAVSQFRNNDKARGAWMNSIAIKGTYEKTGPLRVCAYNKLADKFHFFFIPHSAFQHISKNGVIEIILERVSGCYDEPEFTGIPSRHMKWWEYEVDTFEEMCNIPADTTHPRSTFDSFYE